MFFLGGVDVVEVHSGDKFTESAALTTAAGEVNELALEITISLVDVLPLPFLISHLGVDALDADIHVTVVR